MVRFKLKNNKVWTCSYDTKFQLLMRPKEEDQLKSWLTHPEDNNDNNLPLVKVKHIFFEIRKTRQVSSMIHSDRPTISPIMNIVFTWNLFCFDRFCTRDVRTTCVKTMITTGRDCGSAEWIKNIIHPSEVMLTRQEKLASYPKTLITHVIIAYETIWESLRTKK